MVENNTMKIAGDRTDADWIRLRNQLEDTPILWSEAFGSFFMTRLETRYLDPINLLKTVGNDKGEGFSIVSLQCALIEFLQTTRDGANYRYNSGAYTPEDEKYDYGSSSLAIFTKFLTGQEPFQAYFNETLAKDFYSNVRCSLLHEARTTGGWRITAREDRQETIDETEGGIKYLQRDLFQRDLEQYIWQYKINLLSDIPLQDAFKRKFNALCQG